MIMNQELLKRVQKDCLEIMIDIDKVCRENNIDYSLCGGSVIGVMLYNGFIPWDDDIDIMMTRKNYEKFLKLYISKTTSNNKIINYKTVNVDEVPALFSRIVNPDVEVIEKIAGQVEKKSNVFVDITVFDNVKSKFNFKINEIKRHYVYSYFYKKNNLLPGTKWKRYLYKFLVKDVDNNSLLKKYNRYDKECQKYNKKATKYCSELLSTIFPGRIYTSDLFEEYTDIDFENHKFMIVKDYKKYLFQRYNRTEFTKENKSGTHSHIIAYKKVR